MGGLVPGLAMPFPPVNGGGGDTGVSPPFWVPESYQVILPKMGLSQVRLTLRL